MLRDHSAAEELVQEVFLNVYQALPRFKVMPDAKPSSWKKKNSFRPCKKESSTKSLLNSFHPGGLAFMMSRAGKPE